MKQLHFRETFRPRHMKDLTEKEQKEMLESHMFLKKKETEMSRDATWRGLKVYLKCNCFIYEYINFVTFLPHSFKPFLRGS